MPATAGKPVMAPAVAGAIALWRAGRQVEAEIACAAILLASADQLDARGLLAQIHTASGRYAKAAEHLLRIAELQPTDAAAWRRLGDAQFAGGEYESAAATFRRAITLEAGHPRAHNNLGRALTLLGETDAAIGSYRQAIAMDPKYAIAHSNLGLALTTRGENEEALLCHERAIALKVDFAEAHCNRGNALLRLGRTEAALEAHVRSLALEPGSVVYRCNCGSVLLDLRRPESALGYFAEALRMQPQSSPALNGCGQALRQMRRFKEGLEYYERAIALVPDDIDSQTYKAGILLDMERFEAAIAVCDEVLERWPEVPAALMFRGLSYYLLMRAQNGEAAACFERLLRAEPGHPYALGYLLHSKYNSCDWSSSARVAEAMAGIAAGKPVITPFALMALTDSVDIQLKCAQNFVRHMHPVGNSRLCNGEPRTNDKIRIAYISGDLREHALSYLMTGVFEKHDRERFEIMAVSFQPPVATPFGARILQSLDLFLEVKDESHREIAQLLYDMRIDIAVDLMGHTRGGRPDIFGHRPAPVQVSYLGYPGATGAPYIDYVLADEFVIPPHLRECYSEQVVYLPDTYQANDDRRPPVENPPSRSEVGLPEDAFVFCAFNNHYKITPDVFDIWCRLLLQCPHSVLWLLARTETTRVNLAAAAQDRGVDPSRLIFAGDVPYAQHLARMACADLFLDTFPYCAGTTASDALWAGLPLVTRCGESFASRMAGSLLKTSGLPELITSSAEEYEQLALKLANDAGRLAALRARIAAGRGSNPLFDTQRFCSNLETAYVTMLERARRGEPPAPFAVGPTAYRAPR
jgi:protein O-GlcNAc transferase